MDDSLNEFEREQIEAFQRMEAEEALRKSRAEAGQAEGEENPEQSISGLLNYNNPVAMGA